MPRRRRRLRRPPLLPSLALAYLLTLLLLVLLKEPLLQAGILPSSDNLNLLLRNSPPGWARDGSFHLLGTDQLGRDEFVRLIEGATVSLAVGAAAVVFSLAIGVSVGMAAGYFRGWVDDVLMRLIDVAMGFPSLILALTILYVAGPSFMNVAIVLALTRWPVVARVVRGVVLSLREQQFVEAARASGAGPLLIMRSELLPGILPPVVALATLEFAQAMLSEAALSFLGFGIQPPDASWGLMLAQGRAYLTSAWWLVAFPGLAIMLTALSANLLTGWLRSLVDPHHDPGAGARAHAMPG